MKEVWDLVTQGSFFKYRSILPAVLSDILNQIHWEKDCIVDHETGIPTVCQDVGPIWFVIKSGLLIYL